MRQGHRRAHRYLWLILAPILLIALTTALALRPPPKSAQTQTHQEAGQ